MKVGDYVRLDRCQGINKIVNYNKEEKAFELDEIINDAWGDETYFLDENDIIKSSSNITDLISEDDLLKIEYELASGEKQSEVVQVIKNFEGKLFVNLWIGKFFIEELEHYNKHIKSIVTKEQFDNMEYKVN